MSFTVKFWQFAKKENSTMLPATAGTSFNCTLKDKCSIASPEIVLQTGATNAPMYNYCYIDAFERYYRVSSWTWEEHLWSAQLTVDVLASWKTSIGNASCYVLRAASESTGTIRDEIYPVTGNITPVITMPTDMLPWWSVGDNASGGCYVVGIISGNEVGYYAMGPLTFKDFCAAVLDPTLSNYTESTSLGISNALAKMVFKPFEYITSIIYLPITTAQLIGDNNDYVDAPVTSWRVGFWTLSGVGLLPLKRSKVFHYTKVINLPNHPQKAARGQYMNSAPFTEQYLMLPRIGAVPIDTSLTQDCQAISIDLSIDLVTGESFYDLQGRPNTGEVSIFLGRYSVQLGVAVQLAQDGFTLTNAVDSLANSAASAASAVASPLNIAGSVTSILKMFEPHLDKIGNYGGYIGMQIGTVFLVSLFRSAADDDNAHFGRPLYKQKTLNTLSGYIKCADGDLAISDAYAEEITAIKGYLEGGFYYE